jgi:uncharacterized protein (DUF1501 family)
MDRRTLLKSLAMAGTAGMLPLARRGWAATGDGPGPRLIVVMLRGAVDGLNLVVPYADSNYYRLRGSIAIARPGEDKGALDLDRRFGLHPALAPLLPLWKSQRLAFVHASGSPDPTRSHFDAQDYMESGTPGVKRTGDGWMNRLLGQLGPGGSDSLQAVSLGPVLPRIFSGASSVANVPLGRDAAKPTAMDRPEINAAYDRMYANAGALGTAYREGRESREHILSDLNSEATSPEAMQADHGAPPPQGFALDASQLATLIRRNPGLRLAFMQLGGWDTHINQGAAEGQLANHLKPLAEGLSALSTQLGTEFDNTVVVVMSEFGRTARQNGTNGTDHGHGNVMWVLGGQVRGGKIYGDWPGLDDSALYERRDLAVTTDFRSVLGRVCERHLKLGDRQLAAVFPQAPSAGSKAIAQLI